MNILYLCDEYPPGPHGGIGTSVQLLARQMAKLGHTVVVAGFYSPGYGGSERFDDQGVQVYRFFRKIDTHRLERSRNIPVRALNWFLKRSGIIQADIKRNLKLYQQQLNQLIAKYQIDIIEMPDYHDYMRFCRSYVPFPQLPVKYVVKMNGSMTYFAQEAGGIAHGYIAEMEAGILNNAAAVAGVSQYVANKSAQCFSYHPPITILPNGVDTDIASSGLKQDPLQVTFTGSLVAKKGIFQLAPAWNKVYAALPDAQLLVLGKGHQQKVIKHLDSEALKSVEFKGHVERSELYHHLQRSAVAIFPSYAEAFALAPLEAMVCGAAVINSNRTSGPELIRHETDGLLINPDDIDGIARAIIRLLTNVDLRDELAANGRQRVKEKFDIQLIAQNNLEFYQQTLSRDL